MKSIYLSIISYFIVSVSLAQDIEYAIKIKSFTKPSLTGMLKVANAEGVGVEDFKGKYHLFKANEINSIIVRKRVLPFRQVLSIGATSGGVAVLGILAAADKLDIQDDGVLKVSAIALAAGIVGGLLTATIQEITRRKFHLKVNGNREFYKNNYSKLNSYIDKTPETEHL